MIITMPKPLTNDKDGIADFIGRFDVGAAAFAWVLLPLLLQLARPSSSLLFHPVPSLQRQD